MLGRTIDSNSLSRIRLREFELHQKTIDEHLDPENLQPVSKTFGIMKALDVIPVHLRERLGTKKVALSYVIRPNATPVAIEPLETDRITSQNYESLMDELVARTPHAGAEFAEDNAKVYQIIQDLVQGTSHESSIKTHRRGRDGRAAYLSLVQHNMGSSKWDTIIDQCENYLLRTEWNGKNVRFTLKMHINKHREAHNELERASQFVAYEVPNGHTRVSRLIKSITSKDGAILSALTLIQGDNTKRNDFEEAADFLLLTAPAAKEIERSYRISALIARDTNDSNNSNTNVKDSSRKNDGIGSSGVELRYHSKAEYAKLNGKQRSELHEWRENKRSNKRSADMARISALESQIKELTDLNKDMVSKISALAVSEPKGTTRNPLSNPLNQRNI